MHAAPASNRLVVWSVIASHFGPPFMFSGVAIALPHLGRGLDAGATALGLVETTFLVGSLVFLLPAGRLADAADRATLFRVGMVAFGLLSLAVGCSGHMATILVLRFLQGVAAALIGATSMALLADLVPVERRGRALGAAIGVVYAGLSLGPLAAGALVAVAGWRAVFWGGACVILTLCLLLGTLLPWRWRRPGRVVHWPSMLPMCVAVAAAIWGSTRFGHGAEAGLALAAAGAATAAFVAVQCKVARPLVDLRAIAANPDLRAALFVQTVLYLNAFCSTFLLSLYLQGPLRQSAADAGWFLATGGLVMAVVAPLAGRLADHRDPAAVAAWGIAVVAASAVVARVLAVDSPLWHPVLVLVLQGAGFGLFSSPNMARIMGSMHREQGGMASALAAKSRSVGMVTGMILTGGLVAREFGDRPVGADPERFVAALDGVYSVLAVTASVALAVALATRRRLAPAR